MTKAQILKAKNTCEQWCQFNTNKKVVDCVNLIKVPPWKKIYVECNRLANHARVYTGAAQDMALDSNYMLKIKKNSENTVTKKVSNTSLLRTL